MVAPPKLFKRSNFLFLGAITTGIGPLGLTEKRRLLAAGAFLGLDGGNRRHVENAARGH
jgi:hypothetical protein